MAEDDPIKRGRRDPKKEIAAADWLFQDGAEAKSPKPPDGSGGPCRPGADQRHLRTGRWPRSVHDLALPISRRPSPPSAPSAPGPREESKAERIADHPALDPSALVEEVWSRKAEWGPTLLVVGAWAAFILLFVYFVLGTEYIWSALLTLLVGGMVAVVLSYPILITLERPVRITPEQALRDYYGALSHHLPHFRRMWLLLSTAGRISTAYGSFEGFKAYWKDRLASMRSGHAGSLTPLVFEVADFKADKSAGKVRIDAEFTLKVWVRGQRKAGAIHVIPMTIALVRGPDKMWYLEDGTLGREGRATGRQPSHIPNRGRPPATTASETPGRPPRRRPAPAAGKCREKPHRPACRKFRVMGTRDLIGDGERLVDPGIAARRVHRHAQGGGERAGDGQRRQLFLGDRRECSANTIGFPSATRREPGASGKS